jgi:hypothetical protein
VKRSIHAAFIAAVALVLGPFEFGGAQSISSVKQPIHRQKTQHFVRTRQLSHFVPSKRLTLSSKPSKKADSGASANVAQALPKKGNPTIAKCALKVAKSMNTVGWCYKGVCTALQPLGIHLSGAAAYEAKGQLLKDKRFAAFSISGVHDLKPGDILVHGASASHPYGHIAVYLGNSNEASDHVQQVVLNGPYSGTTVFRYGVHDDNAASTNITMLN